MNYNNSEFLASYGLSRQLPDSDRPEIVFSGRSNVGKSSLINKLCNRKKLARVSATPGKTATINFYRVDTAYFVDLPGYGVPSACLSSCWTAATRPALTMCRCLSTCTTTAFRLWPR